nr:hypothetical protein [Tanacetum cinerariifolium]
MLRNLDNVSGKFLMYPRFIQTFLDKQFDGLQTHKEKYDVSFPTKKVFNNMKRIGNGFSGKETPLFPTMVGPNRVQMGEEDALKRTKTAQQTKIDGLERRVKKLEKKQRLRTHKLKRLYKVSLIARVISSFDDEALDKEDTSKQGRIDEIDADEDIVLVSTHDDVSTQDNIVQDKGIKDVGEEEVVEVVTTAKMIIDAVVDVTQVTTAIADILVSAAETIVTTALTITAESIKINVEIEKPKMLKKRKHQIRADKKLAEKLQAKMQDEIDEEDMLARKRAQKEQEANDALINTWDDIQPKIDADAQLAQRLHEEEQPQLTDAKKAKLFMEFIEKKKFFATKKDEEKRNKPPIKAQQRSIMSTYLKNMDGWKIKSLKKKTELVVEGLKKDEVTEGSLKRAGEELEQENAKKQKMEDDKESAELKQCLEIIPDDGDDVIIDATPLSSKSSTIVEYKIYKEGKKSYSQIFRADGNS